MKEINTYIIEKLKINKDSKFKENDIYPFNVKFTGLGDYNKALENIEKYTEIRVDIGQLSKTPQGDKIHLFEIQDEEEAIWFLMLLNYFDSNKLWNEPTPELLQVSARNLCFSNENLQKISKELPQNIIKEYWNKFVKRNK